METTGLARDDRIISAAVYRLDARGNVEDHWYTLVNPERDPGPVWIHGLTSDVLEGAPLFREIAEEFSERLDGRVLVAHNAIFDWSMIAREYARARARPRRCGSGCAPSRSPRSCGCRCPTTSWSRSPRTSASCSSGRTTRWTTRGCWPRRSGRVCTRRPRDGVRLPLLECRPLTEWSDSPARPADRLPGRRYGGYRPSSWRPSRKRPACPYPNPGRYEAGKPLMQGMRVAFSGDTSVDRELLEDRAIEAGLHVATSVSRLTSLLVTNDPDSATSKTVKAQSFGTPVVDEAAFTQLLRDVAPAAT